MSEPSVRELDVVDARIVIAKAVSGGDVPNAYWYRVADEVLQALEAAGFAVSVEKGGAHR